MPTIDEKTIEIYNKMLAAQRDGNLLEYANTLARSLIGSVPLNRAEPTMEERVRRLDESPVGRSISPEVREQTTREVESSSRRGSRRPVLIEDVPVETPPTRRTEIRDGVNVYQG